MKSLRPFLLGILIFTAPVRSGFAEPMGVENFREDFESFPLAEFHDEVTDALALKRSSQIRDRFETWTFWIRWRPALYDSSGRAKYPTRDAWIRSYVAMNAGQQKVLESRLAGPISVPDAQLLLRWLRTPDKSPETIDTVGKYLRLRRLGIRAPVVFADPVEAAKQLTTWYAMDAGKQNGAAWAEDFALVRQSLAVWAADKNYLDRPALAQRTLFGFPKPFAPISELARQIAGAQSANLHALLDGLAFEGVPAFDAAAWAQLEIILSAHPSDADGEWTQIKALGAMKYQWVWPASTWSPLSELLRRKSRNRPYVNAIFDAVGGRSDVSVGFWAAFSEYGRSDSPQDLESAIAMLNLQARWPESIWSLVFEWVRKSQDPATPQFTSWVKGENFLNLILKPDWPDSVWPRMIPFAATPTNAFFGDDFLIRFLLKLRGASDVTQSLDAVAKFVTADITREFWHWRYGPYPLFRDELWTDVVLRIGGKVLESENMEAKDSVLRAMGKLGSWPRSIEDQVAKIILDPNRNLVLAALASLSAKKVLGDVVWRSLRQKLRDRSDEKSVLWALVSYKGEWRDRAWECIEQVTGHPDATADSLSIVVSLLELHPDWTPGVWAAIPTLFRKVTESRTSSTLTFLVAKQQVWPESFRGQVPALMEDANPVTRAAIHGALYRRPLNAAENQTVARMLVGKPEFSEAAVDNLVGRKNWTEETWANFARLYRTADENRKFVLLQVVKSGPESVHPDFWEVVADELDAAKDDVKMLGRWEEFLSAQKTYPPRIDAILVERLDHSNPEMRMAALKAMAPTSGVRTSLSETLWAALLRRFAETDESLFIYATFALPYGPWPETVMPALLRRASSAQEVIHVELAIQRIPDWTNREWEAEMGLWENKKISLERWITYLDEERSWNEAVWKRFFAVEPDEKVGPVFSTIVDRAMAQKVWPGIFWEWVEKKLSDPEDLFFLRCLYPGLARQKDWPETIAAKLDVICEKGQVTEVLVDALASRPTWSYTTRWHLEVARDRSGQKELREKIDQLLKEKK